MIGARTGSCFMGVAAAAFWLGLTAAPAPLHLPTHQKFVLKNGLTVLLLEKHGVPLIDMCAIIKVGAAVDPPGQEGLAAITAGLLRKGTHKRTAPQFAADLDFIGATFDADARADFTIVREEFLSKDVDRGLDLFFDAILHPTFPPEETSKLLAQTLDGVKGAKDDPQSVLGLYYDGYLLGTHPYGRPAHGDEISLAKIQRHSIAEFYETNYVPGSVILAVAGEFRTLEMRKELEDAVTAWPARTPTTMTIPPTPPVKGRRLLLVDKPDASQTYFALGNTGVAQTDPDRVAIRVVNTIFGGRFTSELNEALRVQSGYSYGASSFFDQGKAPGPFAIRSFTKNETTTEALDLTLKVLDNLHKNGVSNEQLASVKSYIKGQFPPSIETSAQLAQIIAVHEFYGLGDDEVNELEARVDAVTPEIARQVIQKHFPTADNLVFVLIGKVSEIGPMVKKYAEKQDARSISEPGFWPPRK